MSDLKWVKTSAANPCPICKKPDWCMIGEKFILCNRQPSTLPASGGGYLHRVNERNAPAIPWRKPDPRPEPPKIDFDGMLLRWGMGTARRLVALANTLGVDVEALKALGAVWADFHQAWAFPMVDGWGNCIGIRLRNSQGDKWAVKGSHQGIFMPKVPNGPMVFVCEGPTDTAAVLSLGGYAIGRPSCNGGFLELRAACRRLKIHKAVILADHDGPGQEGAHRFAAQLYLRWTIWTPPAKDVREWLALGGTAEMLVEHIECLNWKDT